MLSYKKHRHPFKFYHNIQYSMPATRHPVLIISFATRDAEQFFNPSMIIIAINCIYITRHLEILI